MSFAFNASSEEQDASDHWGGAAYIMQVGGATSQGPEPLEDFPIRPSIPWSVADNTTLPGFSATCWYTAKAILEQRAASPFPDAWAVPLGLIASSWGGTPIRAWASPAVWGSCEGLYPYPPSLPVGPSPSAPSTLHNAMLAPLAVGPMRVSSVVWFQGETDTPEFWYNSNGSYPYYSCMLAGFIADVRAALGSPSAAWVTVQLAPFLGGSELPLFRDMQCRVTRAMPNATCAVIDDDGDPASHPHASPLALDWADTPLSLPCSSRPSAPSTAATSSSSAGVLPPPFSRLFTAPPSSSLGVRTTRRRRLDFPTRPAPGSLPTSALRRGCLGALSTSAGCRHT